MSPFRRKAKVAPRADGYVPNPDDAQLQDMVNGLIRSSPGNSGTYGAVWFKHAWDVDQDAETGLWRFHCGCHVIGKWRVRKDVAQLDGERHVMWGRFR